MQGATEHRSETYSKYTLNEERKEQRSNAQNL